MKSPFQNGETMWDPHFGMANPHFLPATQGVKELLGVTQEARAAWEKTRWGWYTTWRLLVWWILLHVLSMTWTDNMNIHEYYHPPSGKQSYRLEVSEVTGAAPPWLKKPHCEKMGMRWFLQLSLKRCSCMPQNCICLGCASQERASLSPGPWQWPRFIRSFQKIVPPTVAKQHQTHPRGRMVNHWKLNPRG